MNRKNANNKIKKHDKKNKKDKFSIINKDNYLYYIFLILLVFVIVLCVLVYNAKEKYQKTNADIVVHVGEKHNSSVLSLNAKELSKKKMYSLKVTNFSLNKINKKKIEYSITIENKGKSRLKVWKDENLKNLMIDQNSTIIRDVGFGNNKQEYDIYHFKILDKNKVQKNDQIYINILEEKQLD